MSMLLIGVDLRHDLALASHLIRACWEGDEAGGCLRERMSINPVSPTGVANSKYSARLGLEVQRKLQKALDLPLQRGDLLRQLFTDLALEVDERALGLLYESKTLADSSGSGKTSSLCFYEVLAERYAQVPETAAVVLAIFLRLWSQAFASHVFALLFYQWLFEVPVVNSDGFLRYSRAFIEGANNIFWIDLQSNVRRFFSLYNYIFEEVALVSVQFRKAPIQLQRDLFVLLSKFFFFYEPGLRRVRAVDTADRLHTFLSSFPAFSSFGASLTDVFVIELTDQLQKLKIEPVLLQYLRSTKSLKGLELRVTTSTRLKSALYSYTSPGGPMYPTRPVRHAAWETLDCLFPVGRHSRHLISLFFRLLHPYYWPVSVWNFIVTAIKAGLDRVLEISEQIWQRVFDRQQR